MITTETHVYFYGEHFSNWHKCRFIDKLAGNHEFHNTEQAFMYYKAKLFCDESAMEAIKKETDPRSVKQLGREVKNYDEIAWRATRFGFMVYVNYLKFSQNDLCRDKLIKTDDRTIVECSPYDKIWGIGLGLDSPDIFDESKWTGINLLGKSLITVRETLKDK